VDERREHLCPRAVARDKHRRRGGIGVLEILLEQDLSIAVQRDERRGRAQIDDALLAAQGTLAAGARFGHDRKAALVVLEPQRRAARAGARQELLHLGLAAGQHLGRGNIPP
jgi:hypothetical protein